MKNISFSPFQPNSRTGPFPFSSSRPRPAAGGSTAYFPSSPFFLPPAPACWLWPAAPFPLMHPTRTVGTMRPSSSHGLLCAARSGLLRVSPERSPAASPRATPAARVTSPSRCAAGPTRSRHRPLSFFPAPLSFPFPGNGAAPERQATAAISPARQATESCPRLFSLSFYATAAHL